MVTIDPIAISHQVTWCRVLWKRFNDLLCSPYSRGVRGDVKVHHSPAIVRENNEHIQHSQLDRRHSKEIDRRVLAYPTVLKSSFRYPRDGSGEALDEEKLFGEEI